MKWMTGMMCEMSHPPEWPSTRHSMLKDFVLGHLFVRFFARWAQSNYLPLAPETWWPPLSLAGAAGEQRSTSRPVDRARGRNGTWRGALWGRREGGVRRGELIHWRHHTGTHKEIVILLACIINININIEYTAGFLDWCYYFEVAIRF